MTNNEGKPTEGRYWAMTRSSQSIPIPQSNLAPVRILLRDSSLDNYHRIHLSLAIIMIIIISRAIFSTIRDYRRALGELCASAGQIQIWIAFFIAGQFFFGSFWPGDRLTGNSSLSLSLSIKVASTTTTMVPGRQHRLFLLILMTTSPNVSNVPLLKWNYCIPFAAATAAATAAFFGTIRERSRERESGLPT